MKRVYDIGWQRQTSKGGTLKIISRDDKFVYTTCSLCHSDKELFPLPFKTPAGRARTLKRRDPCSCSGGYSWSAEQRSIQVRRVCKDLKYIFHGFLGNFTGNKTYLDLENPATGNRWGTCNIANFLNNRRDPADISYLLAKEISIGDRVRQVEYLLSSEGIPQMIDLGSLTINTKKLSYTKFTWYCKRGHRCVSTFNNFINHGTRCGTCYKVNRSADQGFKGFVDKYYTKHKNREDYLYILKLEGNGECFHKIGRTFNISSRVSKIRAKSTYVVTILYMEKGLHYDIYSREKRLLNSTLDQVYVPSTLFGGWTESRDIPSLEVLLMDKRL